MSNTKYTIEKVDSSVERRIFMALVIDTKFMAEAIQILDTKCFKVPAFRLGINLCVKYFNKHNEAPSVHFKDVFDNEVRLGRIPADMEGELQSIYRSLSSEYVDAYTINRPYLIGQLERLMRGRSLENLSEDITNLISSDKIEDAELLLHNYAPVKREGIVWSDPTNLSDEEFNEFFDEEETLFRYPGAMGELLGDVDRGSFIAIQAPEKRGKTSYLWEFALRSVFCRKKTAFFSIGDMNKKQNWYRVYGWMIKSSRKMAGKTINYPILDCRWGQLGTCPENLQDPIMTDKGSFFNFKDKDPSFHIPCTKCMKDDPTRFSGSRWYEKRIVPEFDVGKARREWKKINDKILGGQNFLRQEIFPNGRCTVASIRTMLDIWEKRDGWIADCVFIDYADNLGNEPGCNYNDKRHQIDASWGAMRGLSLERNISLWTATQAGKSAFQKFQQDESDTSEDKRKMGHVTQMITLNQTPEEKAMGIMRIATLMERESYFDTRSNVVCLQAPAMSRPILTSYWMR